MPVGAKANPTGGQELAADSLARGKHQNPGARAAEHAEKQRQMAARRSGSPGPGAYSPARPTSPGIASKPKSTGQTASFASKSKRLGDPEGSNDKTGDPGAYDPAMAKTLSATSKKSASKNFRQGTGSFGTHQQRKISIEIMGEATPGPGAYNGGVMMRTGKKAALAALDTGERMPSSAFKSKSAKTHKYPNTGVPGAGAYTPSYSAIEKQKNNPANGMKAKGERFKGADTWEKAQATEPGPGAYEVEYLRSGAKSSLSAIALSSSQKDGIAFGSDAMRELPWE